MLADANVEGHLRRLVRIIDSIGLLTLLDDEGLRFSTFAEVGLDHNVDDRVVWQFCQRDRWVLFTDNRNRRGADSLQATLDELWTPGCLPVVTLGRKLRFERDAQYAARVAENVVEIMVGLLTDDEGRQRIFVPS
jgi:hypothetical protein